jgi:hypothetical protein
MMGDIKKVFYFCEFYTMCGGMQKKEDKENNEEGEKRMISFALSLRCLYAAFKGEENPGFWHYYIV